MGVIRGYQGLAGCEMVFFHGKMWDEGPGGNPHIRGGWKKVTMKINKRAVGGKQRFLAGFFQFFNKRGMRLFGTLELETIRCLLT